jgi:hypothetical protein
VLPFSCARVARQGHGSLIRPPWPGAATRDENRVARPSSAFKHLQASDATMRVAQLRVLGGAMARVPAEATAFAHRTRQIMVNLAVLYDGPEDRALRRAWLSSFAAALRQGDAGAYVNFLGDEGEARVRDAYPGSTWDRLVEIKCRYDPTNLFRLNQNIPPATGGTRDEGLRWWPWPGGDRSASSWCHRHAAVTAGHRVRCSTAAELVETLYQGLANNSIGRVIDRLLRKNWVLVDEIGFAPLGPTGTQLLSCVGFGWYEGRAMRQRKDERLQVRLVRKC